MRKSAGRPALFERLQAGLGEGIRFARGELNLRTIEVLEGPPALQPKDVVGLRRKLCMSQRVFARLLNVSPKTVQSWEQGERTPSQAALRLLQVLAARPEVVWDIVGVQPSSTCGAEETPDVKKIIKYMQKGEGPTLGPGLTIRDLRNEGRRS